MKIKAKSDRARLTIDGIHKHREGDVLEAYSDPHAVGGNKTILFILLDYNEELDGSIDTGKDREEKEFVDVHTTEEDLRTRVRLTLVNCEFI